MQTGSSEMIEENKNYFEDFYRDKIFIMDEYGRCHWDHAENHFPIEHPYLKRSIKKSFLRRLGEKLEFFKISNS